MKHPSDNPDPQDLRETAERQLGRGVGPALPLPETPEALRHELSVHQIELELQNEELRRTVEQLREAHERYVGLYDYAPVGYFTLGADGTIGEANLRAGRLLGVERSRLRGRRLMQFAAPESRTTLAVLLPRLMASGAGLVAELRLQRGDGSTFPVRLEGQAYAPGGSLIAVTDISTEKAAQEELLRLNETLEQRVEERTAKVRELGDELRSVAQAVAEDLMAPLRRISAFADLLRRDAPATPGTPGQDFGPVFRSVERMQELAQALLEYTRVSQMRVRLVPLDLNRVLAEVRKDLQGRLQGRAVEVRRCRRSWPTAAACNWCFSSCWTTRSSSRGARRPRGFTSGPRRPRRRLSCASRTTASASTTATKTGCSACSSGCTPSPPFRARGSASPSSGGSAPALAPACGPTAGWGEAPPSSWPGPSSPPCWSRSRGERAEGTHAA